jgi:NAD(P)-dependent dehydrogenase (short-subunit alcohol dehydrogenase family)
MSELEEGSCTGKVADITQANDVSRLAQTALDAFGRIDMLINGGLYLNS